MPLVVRYSTNGCCRRDLPGHHEIGEGRLPQRIPAVQPKRREWVKVPLSRHWRRAPGSAEWAASCHFVFPPLVGRGVPHPDFAADELLIAKKVVAKY